ncbi:hypothetical protein FRB94_011925 [Tulasnella sp. JGI-2019a]|nr:hypothetical protein FRB94_011925 [Tulasnella sp. JGI-2019a]KAG9022542.1 hypothetical protein FRB95_014628 [Tulasnella sp. JGI-2019a]
MYDTDMMDYKMEDDVWEINRGGYSATEEAGEEMDIVIDEEGSEDAPTLTEYASATSAGFNGHLGAMCEAISGAVHR